MSHIYLRVHLIWSTRNREPRLDTAWRGQLFAYMQGICQKFRATLIKAGGVEDHVHLYVALPSTLTVADLVRHLKSNSSRWVAQTHDAGFSWQNKYAAFSVSASSEVALKRYIDQQVQHHKSHTFKDELQAFLLRHGFDFDVRDDLE